MSPGHSQACRLKPVYTSLHTRDQQRSKPRFGSSDGGNRGLVDSGSKDQRREILCRREKNRTRKRTSAVGRMGQRTGQIRDIQTKLRGSTTHHPQPEDLGVHFVPMLWP
ncbi:hypothetical protein BJX62DRAFT_148631 [Aspergillus germanicus]